jgi:hypothetical protein
VGAAGGCHGAPGTAGISAVVDAGPVGGAIGGPPAIGGPVG